MNLIRDLLKNVDELHEKYYDVYRDDYDTNDELKRKGLTIQSLN